MKYRKAFGAAVLVGFGALASASSSTAQEAGIVELGVFGVNSLMESRLNIKDNMTPLGVGARAGLFLTPNLKVEADIAYSDGELSPIVTDVNYIPTHARLLYNLFVGDNSAILIGAGAGRALYDYPGGWRGFWDAGALIGFRQFISRSFSIRADIATDYRLTTFAGADGNVNVAFQLGISKSYGRGNTNPDTDADGIPDEVDQCGSTPAGAPVDASGCRIDSDGDGVYDNLDACPNTEASARVDARGCAMDSDHDGIADNNDRCVDTAAGEVVDSHGCPRDADGDGVPDSRDSCGSTPAGVAVDATGCRSDTDGDGVSDAVDRCSATPAGAAVDATGCALDSDGDGVPDHADSCAGTRAGATVGTTGCASDTDRDGVPDGIDRCSATRTGTPVDLVGCPVLFAEGVETVVLEGVTFETSSTRLVPMANDILDIVVESLLGHPEVKVEVAGHTDSQGSHDGNVDLSHRRAEAVRAYLVSKGVAASRITAVGYGQDRPVADNATAAGRAQNRRVELRRVMP
jgi:outer membrane protein OmpA-like peptidoglycan-associated protein